MEEVRKAGGISAEKSVSSHQLIPKCIYQAETREELKFSTIIEMKVIMTRSTDRNS